MRSAALLLTILVLVSAVVAQAPAPASTPAPAGYTETFEVRIHNLDVIVTDKEGNAVRGLTKEDFLVTEDGKPQAITNFAIYDDAVPQSDHGLTEEGGQTSVVSAPPPRRFVFFIDDMAIQARARGTLKQHITELVRTMRPGDVAAVVRPSGTTRMVQNYSGDPVEIEKGLHKVIDSCKVKVTNQAFAELQTFRRAMQSAESPYEVAAAKRLYVDMTRGRVEQRISQLRALSASMAGSDGKKILVVITSGLSVEPGREAYGLDEQLAIFDTPKQQQTVMEQDANAANAAELSGAPVAPPLPSQGRLRGLRADIQTFQARPQWQGAHRVESASFREEIADLARTAAADGVTIYALEPEVPQILAVTRGADSRTVGSTILGGPVSAHEVVPSQMLNDLLHYNGESLTSLTETTGGSWFRGVGAIDDVFRRLSDDLHFYYSLAYTPTGSATKSRRVKVTVRNRPDLKVRTRTEVIERPAGREMSGRVIAALLYPTDVNDLQMKVSAEKPEKDGKKKFIVPIEVVIPVNKLTLLRDEDGTYRGMVSVHYASSLNEKEFVSYGRQDQMVELTPQQYAQQARGRYRYNSRISVPKGNVRIVVGVVDSASRAASLQSVSLTTK
ncbi:MAG TPA: VWA domain-containing protein [Thermoanaerobaculia bacterium]|nr:VWA domain-containing protein [Thermoanaerobaculia bacterium]